MSDSPVALCPRCGELLSVFESEAGLYLGCTDECLWASEPIGAVGDPIDLEPILREIDRQTQNDPDAT